jgi:hypothetical protein
VPPFSSGIHIANDDVEICFAVSRLHPHCQPRIPQIQLAREEDVENQRLTCILESGSQAVHGSRWCSFDASFRSEGGHPNRVLPYSHSLTMMSMKEACQWIIFAILL